ncbi:class I SAM-dependent methyltransferase [Candidatus Marithrix sp. Canyon 246]|uniref:class I SAM-dependent methyltransferase n=1 Tax=Candidatus Marithrix sp. Canyon 246 TaxID=1827136 RepID=UPI00084A2670|nr:class I SAM-dependent methyltransferase [Candidatus Marithrix sp. Canyon 246]
MNTPTQANLDYYNNLYGHRNPLLHWFHGRISFDQQSKTKLNRMLLIPIIKKLIKNQDSVRVLDYGCGWGTFLLSLPRKNIQAYGFDIVENTIKTLEKTMRMRGRKLHRIELNKGNEINPQGFDVILCSHVLEHVESDLALLQSFKAALRSGGYLLINVPINEVWDDPKHVRHYDAKILAEKMNQIGMNVITSTEEDRWTGFLLQHETTGNLGRLTAISLRAFRALLAVMPLFLVRWSEKLLLKSTPTQQLLMLASKADD